MNEREKVLERKLNRSMKDLGGWSIKLLPTFITGLPDRMILLPKGIMFFMELKTTGFVPSPAQFWVHKKLRGMGFAVYVVDNSIQLFEILESYE